MKKLCVLLCSVIIAMTGLSVSAWAWDDSTKVVGADITEDSVLVVENYDGSIKFEVKAATSLGYQEIVLPYGTDLLWEKFYLDYEKIDFSISDEVKQAYKLKDEWIDGYKIALRDILRCSEEKVSINGGEYEDWYENNQLEEGVSYTIIMESDTFFLPEKENYTHASYRNLTINQGRKFAFKIRIADENGKTGEAAPIIEGNKFNVTEGEDTECVIRIDEDFDNFEGVMCNDEMLERDVDYTVKEGSTIVTLSKDYVKSLNAGEYTIKAVFRNCYSEPTVLTVTAASEPPAAGDTCNIILLATLLLTACATTVIFNRKQKATDN